MATEPSGANSKHAEPAERGDELVLLADRAFEHVDLDVARLLGERSGGDLLAFSA